MHTDDINDFVLMGLARDSAEAEAKQLRETVAALEARIAKADALADGRPCETDVWLQSAFDTIDDHYDFRDAVKAWLHGDWSGAMEWVEEYRESDT